MPANRFCSILPQCCPLSLFPDIFFCVYVIWIQPQRPKALENRPNTASYTANSWKRARGGGAMILYCDGRVVPPAMSYCTAWPGKRLLSYSAAQLLSCSAAQLLAIPAAAANTGMLPTLYRKHRHLPNSTQVL